MTLIRHNKGNKIDIPNSCASGVLLLNLYRLGVFEIPVQTTDDWEHIEGLIDGLIESGGPGHQYLTREGDGILIELAYNE